MALLVDRRDIELAPPAEPSARPRHAGMRAPLGRTIGSSLLIAVLAFLTLYPLSMLLYGSLHTTPPGMAGEFNLDGYWRIVSRENIVVFLNTVALSFAKTIPALLLAVVLAWIIARTDTPYAPQLEVLITLP